MAKITRVKKAKDTEIVESSISTPESTEPQIVEKTVLEPVDTSEPNNEEKEVLIETELPVVAESIQEEPKPIEIIQQSEKEELSMKDSIVKFLQSRQGEFVKINDFIKSLYPLPKFNEPPKYLQQGETKVIKQVLLELQSAALIKIEGNMHTLLGTMYYPDTTTMKTQYHNLNSVVIRCSI